MKVPNFQPPNEIDHPNLPDEAYAAMHVLSEQVNKLTLALQNNISPEDNENSETRTLAFQHGVKQSVDLQVIKGRPREVRVLDHALFERVDLAWEVIESRKIGVALSWPSAPSGSIEATILIRGASDADY